MICWSRLVDGVVLGGNLRWRGGSCWVVCKDNQTTSFSITSLMLKYSLPFGMRHHIRFRHNVKSSEGFISLSPCWEGRDAR